MILYWLYITMFSAAKIWEIHCVLSLSQTIIYKLINGLDLAARCSQNLHQGIWSVNYTIVIAVKVSPSSFLYTIWYRKYKQSQELYISEINYFHTELSWFNDLVSSAIFIEKGISKIVTLHEVVEICLKFTKKCFFFFLYLSWEGVIQLQYLKLITQMIETNDA